MVAELSENASGADWEVEGLATGEGGSGGGGGWRIGGEGTIKTREEEAGMCGLSGGSGGG